MKRIGYAVAMLCELGMAGGNAAAAENNSSQAPLILTSTIPQPDFILKDCQETEHTADPRSALRSVDPAYALKNYIQNRDNHYVDLAAIKNIILLDGTKHGAIVAGTSNYGRTAFRYDPEPGYLGNDRAVFMAEFEGKRYKIVIDLHVLTIVHDNMDLTSCPPPSLIKVNQPASVGRNNQRALRRMDFEHSVQCAALIAPYTEVLG